MPAAEEIKSFKGIIFSRLAEMKYKGSALKDSLTLKTNRLRMMNDITDAEIKQRVNIANFLLLIILYISLCSAFFDELSDDQDCNNRNCPNGKNDRQSADDIHHCGAKHIAQFVKVVKKSVLDL